MNNTYISHHGILGMKWGKRNGPPYPLGLSDHSASEKKAGWQDSLNGSSKNKSDSQRQLARKVDEATVKRHGQVDGFDQKKIQELPEVKEAFGKLSKERDKYADTCKLAKDFGQLSDDKLLEYQNKAWKYAHDKYRPTTPFEPLKKDGYMRWEDWDQGDHSSFDIYAREHGSNAMKEQDREIVARRKYREAQKNVVDAMLGEYGSTPIKGAKTHEEHSYDSATNSIVTSYKKDTIADAVNAALDILAEDEAFRKKYYTPV